MESAEQGRQTKQFDIVQQPDSFAAILATVAGLLGLVMVAAGPWLLLNPNGLYAIAQLVAL